MNAKYHKYHRAVAEFSKTYRRKGEKFSEQFERIVRTLVPENSSEEDEIWRQVLDRNDTWLSCGEWMDSHKNKAVLVRLLRKPVRR